MRDNPGGSHYGILDGEQVAGFATCRLTGDRIAFPHTEVAPAFAVRGWPGSWWRGRSTTYAVVVA